MGQWQLDTFLSFPLGLSELHGHGSWLVALACSKETHLVLVRRERREKSGGGQPGRVGVSSLPKGTLHHRTSLALFVAKPSPLLSSSLLLQRSSPLHHTCCVCVLLARASSRFPSRALAVPAVRPHHLPSAARRKESTQAAGALFGSSGPAISLGKATQKAASRVVCLS